MKLEIVNNYVKFDSNNFIPYYIFNKLSEQYTSDNLINDITEIVKAYRTCAFYYWISDDILNFIVSLFRVNFEVYSNPFINILPFCSNFKIDKLFQGINSINNLNLVNNNTLLLIDPRPYIDSNQNHFLHVDNDLKINTIINNSINIILKFKHLAVSLIIISQLQLSFKIHNELIYNNFDISKKQISTQNFFIYFIQSKSGHSNNTPTYTKIDIIKSYISKQITNTNIHQSKIDFIIYGHKKK